MLHVVYECCVFILYTGVLSVHGSAYFGEGTGLILLDDVACNGNEESLFSCSHESTHNCYHGEDVGVSCYG